MRSAFIKIVLAAVIVSSGAVIYQQIQEQGWFTHPCESPIEYSLGSFDARFNISQNDFMSAVEEASQVWEKAINRDLFVFNDEGSLKINLVYDERQQATQSLKDLGYKIDNTKSSYDSLKVQYEAKVSQYEQLKSAYESQVQYWNSRGGAPKKDYDQLKTQQDQLKQMVAEINSLVTALNNLGKQLNLNVADYNSIGGSRGEEFEEGVYVRDRQGTRIDVYEFSDRPQLVRLLAHELGHALGLEHVEDPNAVMYRLNVTTNEKLTTADIAELKQVCKINP